MIKTLTIITFFCSLAITASTQHLEDSKWKNAVINLETISSDPNKSLYRSNGTAIFIEIKEKKYLVTARHVLWDSTGSVKDLKEYPNKVNKDQKGYQEKIYPVIYRRPKIDELNDIKDTFSLLGLGSGPSISSPYTFSSPKIDLAVISLDHPSGRYSKFGHKLIEHGYKPISLDDISVEPTKERQHVFTYGYPKESEIEDLKISSEEKEIRQNWASNKVVRPVKQLGAVKQTFDEYFLCYLRTSPGFSGGPVISETKLVGATVANYGKDFPGSGVSRVIEAKHILKLIEIQEGKDKLVK